MYNHYFKMKSQKQFTGSSSTLLEKTGKPQTQSVFQNSKDFPELRRSNENQKHKYYTDKQTFKSWSAAVERNSSHQNVREAFPKLSKGNSLHNKKQSNIEENKVLGTYKTKDVSATSEQQGEKVNAVENVTNNKKNKDSSKKEVVTPPKNLNKKRRKDPIFINLSEFIEVNKSKQKNKNKVLRSRLYKCKETERLCGNILDSSNPKRSKGKHREVKKKQLSKLKLAIITERIIKQKSREMALLGFFGKDYVDLVTKIDFKKEIEKYLNESAKRKIKRFEKKNNSVNEKTNEKSENKYSNKIVKSEKKVENSVEVQIKKEDDSITSSEKQKDVSTVNCQKEIKFSSKIREYCDNLLTPGLNLAVSELIKSLVNFQDKYFAKDQIKAKVKRRHVCGFREVKKYFSLKKVKLVVIAPNLEKLQTKGSVYDIINELKTEAQNQNVPYAFALDRYKLGRCTKKNVPVSAFAVLNYEGAENLFEKVLEELKESKRQFLEMAPKKVDLKAEKSDNTDVNSQVILTLISAFKGQIKISNNDDDPKVLNTGK